MSPFLLLVLQDPAPAIAAPAIDFKLAPVVAESNRMRLTPRLDGKIEEEEWDALGESQGVKTFLQWEPGALHVAAASAMGKDLIVSLDPGGDGWLVGRNNVEARIGLRDGKAVVKLRVLDASNVAGPTYREIPGLEAASQAVIGPDGTIEVSIVDPGMDLLPTKNGRFAARVDVVPSETASFPANDPRILAPLTLGEFRSAALPTGVKARSDFNNVPALPGDDLSIRFGFSGEPMPKRVSMRSEGLAREATSATETPFTNKGKKEATIDYRTRIQTEASVGYRIARATLTGDDGVPALLQASFRIAPLLDLELKETHLKPSDKDRSIRVGFIVKGNSRKRLAGDTTISVPGGYRLINGDDRQRINLFEPRLPLTKSFGLFIPANSTGTVPVTFSFEMAGKKFDLVRYVTID